MLVSTLAVGPAGVPVKVGEANLAIAESIYAAPITDPCQVPVPIVPNVVILVDPAVGEAPISVNDHDTPADPSTLLPVDPIVSVLAVSHAEAVLAFPVNAPTNVVEVTDVSPAIVVADDPRDIAVDPTVTLEFIKAPFGILVKDDPEPLKVVAVTVPENVGLAIGAREVSTG